MSDNRMIAVEEKEEGSLCRYAKRLQGFGLDYMGDGKYAGEWKSVRQELNVRDFAKKHKARFFFDDEFGSRTRDYRTVFHRTYRPAVRGRYFCAYCGRLLTEKQLTVDHLYPVAKVSRSMKMRKKLRREGIMSLNDAKNLVPACMSCNRHKKDRMGLWILRGKIGRSAFLWHMRWMARYAMLVLFAMYLWGVHEHGVMYVPFDFHFGTSWLSGIAEWIFGDLAGFSF